MHRPLSLHQPPAQPITTTIIGFVCALLAHGLLGLILFIGLAWQPPSNSGVEAEIWTDIPPVLPTPVLPQSLPSVSDQAAAVAAARAAQVQAQQEADAQIALAQQREREQQLLEKQRQEALQAEQEKERERQREKRKDEERQQLAEKKRAEEDARRKEEERRKAEQKKRQEQERLAAERQKVEQKEREKLEREKQERNKLAEQKQQKKLIAEKQQAQQKATQRLQNERIEQARIAQLARLRAVADETGSGGVQGTASGSGAAGLANYADRVRQHVKPHIVFDVQGLSSNPAAVVMVELAPDGALLSKRLVKSSGRSDWDAAVLLAVERASPLPRAVDGKVPTSFTITFKPRD